MPEPPPVACRAESNGVSDPEMALRRLGALVAGQLSPAEVPIGEWTLLAELALEHGLGPMLWYAVNERDPALAARPVLHPLLLAALRATANYAGLEQAQRQVDAALTAAGIPCVWLKGIALACTVYARPGLRPMCDLDAWIPAEPRLAALRVMESLGYRWEIEDGALFVGDDALALKMRHHFYYHYVLWSTVGPKTVVELHFDLWPALLPQQEASWFWSQVRREGDAGITTVSPEAHLLYLCAHAIYQHGEHEAPLLRFFDVHRLVVAGQPDWRCVLDQAVRLGWTYAVGRALTQAVHYFGCPVPAYVFDELRARRPAREGGSPAARGQVARWSRLVSALHHLPTSEQLRVLWRGVFPSREYMKHQYSIRPGRPTWPYYVCRWYDQGRAMLAWFRGSRL